MALSFTKGYGMREVGRSLDHGYGTQCLTSDYQYNTYWGRCQRRVQRNKRQGMPTNRGYVWVCFPSGFQVTSQEVFEQGGSIGDMIHSTIIEQERCDLCQCDYVCMGVSPTVNTTLLEIPSSCDGEFSPVKGGPGSNEESNLGCRPPKLRSITNKCQ